DAVAGKELAVQSQDGLFLALVLVEQFLELAEQPGEVRAEAVAPEADAGVRPGEQSHEHVRATEAVPARLTRQPQRLLQGIDRRLRQQLQAEATAGLEDVVRAFVRRRHDRFPVDDHDPPYDYGPSVKLTQGFLAPKRPALSPRREQSADFVLDQRPSPSQHG